MKSHSNGFFYDVYSKDDQWYYKIYIMDKKEVSTLLFDSQEGFETKQRAIFAAVGHTILLANGAV